MNISTRVVSGYLVVSFDAPLTYASQIDEQCEMLHQQIENGMKRVALRFHPDSVFTPALLAHLVKCAGTLHGAGGKLVIVSPTMLLEAALHDVGVHDKVRTCRSLEELAENVSSGKA